MSERRTPRVDQVVRLQSGDEGHVLAVHDAGGRILLSVFRITGRDQNGDVKGTITEVEAATVEVVDEENDTAG